MATRNTVWRWNDMRDQRKNRRAPLEQFVEGWLLWGNLAPKTRRWYREVFDTFTQWVRAENGQGVLGELDPQLVRRWQYDLEARGRSVNTIRGYLAALKSFARYLAEERIVLDKRHQPLNLLAEVKVPKIPRHTPEVYKDAELESILSGINRHNPYGARLLAFIRLMVDGGLRLNEACQVRVEDIDWGTGRVLIRWQTAKRRKERETSVGRRTLLELRRYVEEYRPVTNTTDQLFVDQDGGPLQPHAVQSALARLNKKLGLKRLSAHQFRRTWATNFRRMGVGDLYDLQREGGWEDLSVPQRFYVDVSESRERRASVLDRWETVQRKRQRAGAPNAPIQVHAPVQGSQVHETRKMSRSGGVRQP